MNMKFVISVVAVFVVSMFAGFVVHGLLLGGDYKALPEVMRLQEDGMGTFQWMLLGHLFFSIGLTWVYRAGKGNRPWLGQGVRFGLAIAILATVPTYLIYHAVAQFPLMLAFKQIVFESVAMVLLGIVAAYINR